MTRPRRGESIEAMAGVITEEAGRIRLGQARGRWVLAAAVLGSSMTFLDANRGERGARGHPVAEPECVTNCAVGAPPLEPVVQMHDTPAADRH